MASSPRSPFRDHNNRPSSVSSPHSNSHNSGFFSDSNQQQLGTGNNENLIGASYSYSPTKRTDNNKGSPRVRFQSARKSLSMDSSTIAAMRKNSSLIDVAAMGTAGSFASTHVDDYSETASLKTNHDNPVPVPPPSFHPTVDDLAVLDKPTIAREQTAEDATIFSSDNPFEGLANGSQDDGLEQKTSSVSWGGMNEIVKVETVTSDDSGSGDGFKFQTKDAEPMITTMSMETFDVTSEDIADVAIDSDTLDGGQDVFKPLKAAVTCTSMALSRQNPFDQFVPSYRPPQGTLSTAESDVSTVFPYLPKNSSDEASTAADKSVPGASSKETVTTEPESISDSNSKEESCEPDLQVVPSNASSDAFSGIHSQFDGESTKEDKQGSKLRRERDANFEDESSVATGFQSTATDKTPKMHNLDIEALTLSPLSPRDRYLMAVKRSIANQKAAGPITARERYLLAIKEAAEKGKAMSSTPKEVPSPITTPVKAQIRKVERGGFRESRSFERISSRSFSSSRSVESSASPINRCSYKGTMSSSALGGSKDEAEGEEQPLEFGSALFDNVASSAAEMHTKQTEHPQALVHPKGVPSAFHSFHHDDVSRSSSGELPVKEKIDVGRNDSQVKSYLQLDVEAAVLPEPLEIEGSDPKSSGSGPIDALRSSFAMIWNSKPIPRLTGSHPQSKKRTSKSDSYTSVSSPVKQATNDTRTDTMDNQSIKPLDENDICCQVPNEGGIGAMESLRSSLMLIWNSKPKPALTASSTPPNDDDGSFVKTNCIEHQYKSTKSASTRIDSMEQGCSYYSGPSYGDSKRERVYSEDSSDASSYRKTQKKKTRHIDGLSVRQKPSDKEARMTMGNQYLSSGQHDGQSSRERTITPIPPGEDLLSPGLLGGTGRNSYDSLEDLDMRSSPRRSYRASPKASSHRSPNQASSSGLRASPKAATLSPKTVSYRVSPRKGSSLKLSPKGSSYRDSLSPVKPCSTTETENSFINAALKARNVNDVVVIYSGTPETRVWHPPEQERKEHDTMVRAILERPSLIDKSIRDPFQPRQLDWRDVRKWTLVTMAMLFFLAVIAGCLACGITGNCARRNMNNVMEEEPTEYKPLVLDFPEYTQESLKSLHTAQTKAYMWLENDPNRDSYSNSRKMQRFALATLYYSTKIAQNWTASTSWLSYDIHECYWFSSYEGKDVCEDDEIKHLVLTKNNLRGNLPPELALLTSLVELDLSRNVLIGPIPEQFQDLTSLQHLWLEKNELNGDIPSELGTMTSLKTFALATNEFKGTIASELAALTNLKKLRLFYNFLTGTVPTELGYLTGLELLDVDVNNLSGTMPTQLGLLSNLQELWLDWNSFVGPIPTEFGRLVNLNKLYLGRAFVGEELRDEDWQLVGDYQIPTELGLLTKIEELYLDNNDLTGMIPTELSALTNLTRLTLDNNFVTDSISPGICSLFGGQLESLSIDCSEVFCSCGCTCV